MLHILDYMNATKLFRPVNYKVMKVPLAIVINNIRRAPCPHLSCLEMEAFLVAESRVW
jgi:hypothetical protein